MLKILQVYQIHESLGVGLERLILEVFDYYKSIWTSATSKVLTSMWYSSKIRMYKKKKRFDAHYYESKHLNLDSKTSSERSSNIAVAKIYMEYVHARYTCLDSFALARSITSPKEWDVCTTLRAIHIAWEVCTCLYHWLIN